MLWKVAVEIELCEDNRDGRGQILAYARQDISPFPSTSNSLAGDLDLVSIAGFCAYDVCEC
jgi:hypothetical protein